MLPDIPRISVLMITYNQEQIVNRALDSLLSQKDYLYEICINDDCSTDGTFNVLLEYQSRYPDLVKPVRNEHNLGIFENIEATWVRPSGDIIYRLAGDDECGKGYFKKIVNFIQNKGIDWKNEMFCIYGDYVQMNKDGQSIRYKNKMVVKHNPIKLKIRKLLSNRSACFSKKVLDKYVKVSEGRNYNAELVQDCQLQLFSKYNYYLPEIGNVYYAQIGVSTKLNRKEVKESVFGSYDRFIPFVAEQGRPLDNKDLAFIDYMKAYRTKNYKKMFLNYFRSIDLSLGFGGLQLKRVLFVFRNKKKK